jgi:peptide/nickel transport system ATP-binding protein
MPHPPSSALLRVEDLTKVFNIRHGFATQKFHAVDEATFSLDSNEPEIFTIAGESGSGKTTLARIILGMERPTDGILRYKDRDVAELSRHEKRAWFFREVQPVFQDPFATFSPLKRIDHYLYETVYNYKVTNKAGADAYISYRWSKLKVATPTSFRAARRSGCPSHGR